MDGIDQTKQVFVDDSGRRGRLLAASMRLGCVLVGAYLLLLVAGFLGASWVPSVRLPVVGDIFDVGSSDALPGRTSAAEGDARDQQSDDAEAQVEAAVPENGPLAADEAAVAGPTTERRSRGRSAADAPDGSRNAPGVPAPQSSPNRGTASGNPNAGPKTEKTPQPQPSPNRGSSGNSENAGPKPKPTKAPGRGNSAKDQEPEPSPAPAP